MASRRDNENRILFIPVILRTRSIMTHLDNRWPGLLTFKLSAVLNEHPPY